MIAHPPKRNCSSELSPRVGDNRTDDAMTKLSYAELDKETIAKAYARWAPVYDVVFGAVFERGRQAAIAAAERIGARRRWGRGGWRSWPTESSHPRRPCGPPISRRG